MKGYNLTLIEKASVDSTQEEAKRILTTTKAPYAIVTHRQTAGKGRCGRSWFSQANKSLTFSLVLELSESWKPLQHALAGIAALVLRDVLRQQKVEHLVIKWPNDLLINGKKLCGILVDILPAASETYAIIGIGLNVNLSENDLPKIAEKPVTSLLVETGREWPLLNLLEIILHELLETLASDRGQQTLAQWIQACSWMVGNRMNVHLPDGTSVPAKILGFSENGHMNILREDTGASLSL